ncbi:site-specific integrase [Haploplasma modicum]|uniref:site-specific integrase n=1 Tax=Haploplasma modicum TaxID=2150 RepID=UPI00138B09B6|nr:site-specific integrase [Haploplasma modicum]
MEYNKDRYIDFKVFNIMKIKNKYGFRFVLIYSNGEQSTKQKSGFKTIKEAEATRNKVITDLNNGFFLEDNSLTYISFLNDWLEKDIKLRTASNTYITFKNIVQKYIGPTIGNIRLQEIERNHIVKVVNYASGKYKSMSKMVKTVLDISLDYAVSNQLLTINISRNVIITNGNKNKGKVKTRNIDITKTLTLDQIKLLIKNSMETPIKFYIMFSGLMGLRISEIRGLKYSDINYQNRTIKIQRQLGRDIKNDENINVGKVTKQEIPLKTFSSQRELIIPDILFEEILKERRKYEKNRSRRINDKHNPFYDGDFICSSTYGNPRSSTFHYKYFKDLLVLSNLPNIRFHDLRASYTTILIKNKFSPKAVSKMLGHATEIISIDHYTDSKELIKAVGKDINFIVDKYTLNNNEKEIEEIHVDKNVINAIVNMELNLLK